MASLGLSSLIAITLLAVRVFAQEPSLEKDLRSRVEGFYLALHTGQNETAESFLTIASRPHFRSAPRGAILGAEWSSAKIDPSVGAAEVRIRVQIVAPYTAKPITVAATSQWKLVDGVWYMEYPKPSDGGLKMFEAAKQPVVGGPIPPEREELKFKGHRWHFGEVRPGQLKTARFPFTNVKDHTVKITSVETSCECLKVKTTKMEYKAGESGELLIEFNRGERAYNYDQTIVVKTDPGGLATHLRVTGFLIPRGEPSLETSLPAAVATP